MDPNILQERLRQAPPRVVRYKSAITTGHWVMWNVLVATLLLVIWGATSEVKTTYLLATEGKQVEARVVDKHISRGKSTSYYLDFTFQVAGGLYEGKDSVSSSEYESTPIGAGLTVTYLPSNPETFRVGVITNEDVRRHKIFWTFGICFGALIIGAILWGVQHEHQQQRDLLRNGIAVQARVTDRKVHHGKSTTYSLVYMFPVIGESGIRENTVYVTRTQYEMNGLGVIIPVLYDPKSPLYNKPFFAIGAAELV